MRKGIYGIAIACIGVFLCVSCSPESKKGLPVEKRTQDVEYFVIDKDVYLKDRKGPVRFTHDLHYDDYGIECNDCHHVYVDGENVWTPDESPDTCESCHDPVAGFDEVYRLETAFHKNCRTCHSLVNEGDELTPAPITCLGCHETQKH